jgi:hypothetical protein
MRKGIVVLAATAALGGCSGGDGAPDEPETRAVLHLSGQEGHRSCPPVTASRLAPQGVAFSGTVRFERPNPDNPDRVEWAVHVDHWYSEDLAEVMVIHPTSDIALGYFSGTVAAGSALIEDGDHLLVAGERTPRKGPAGLVGYADSCLTRRWSADLAERYERAFAG